MPPVVVTPPVATTPKAAPPATIATAATTQFGAHLTVSQEVPSPRVAGVGAAGTFTATLSGRMFHWTLKVSNLSGEPVAAVFHKGAQGVTGPRLLELCGRCKASASGTKVLTQAQITSLMSGALYVNVGTHSNPAGEIRGQITRTTIASLSGAATTSGGGGGHVSHSSHASHSSHSSHSSHYSGG